MHSREPTLSRPGTTTLSLCANFADEVTKKASETRLFKVGGEDRALGDSAPAD
jgi:hypothetical protein